VIAPPVAPMLARLVRELPEGDVVYEPKWDGFRCLAFRSGGAVDLRSRNDRPLARYFPEVVAALEELPGGGDLVLDGELLAARDGALDFPALMSRLHPARSRAELLACETPAWFVAFDALAIGGEDLVDRPFAERRARLAGLLGDGTATLRLTEQTDDPAVAARWLEDFGGAGLDGVVAKPRDGVYEPGARAMLKVKRERTADCVVAGLRGTPDPEPHVTSLLLGLYDDDGALHHVGVASGMGRARGRALFDDLHGSGVALAGHPWEHGFLLAGGPTGRLKGAAARWTPDMPLDWVPLRPELVCEAAYDQVDDGRWRHPGRFVRWRPDREPSSCRTDQLVERRA